MPDIGAKDNPLENEYLELRLLQIDAQIKAKEIRIKELNIQIGKEESNISNLKDEKKKVNEKLIKQNINSKEVK